MSPAKPASTARIFRPAEKPASMSDAAFREKMNDLRLDLIALQQKIRKDARFPVITVLAGVKGAGVIDTLNLLNTWMDPRWIETHAFDTPSDEERERPPFWRYWRSLPAAGAMGLYLEGWYGALLGIDPARPVGRGLDDRLRHIAAFEQTLADGGALILKFWLHLSERHQKARSSDQNCKDPIFGLRPADHAWRAQPPYSVYCKTAASIISQTDMDRAPWLIVPGQDANHRRFRILDALRDAFRAHVKRMARPAKAAKPKKDRPPRKDVLAALDLSQSMSDRAYAEAFHAQQERLHKAQRAARDAALSSVLVFEGWDAAGKGGAIRRLTYALSAYNYKVVPIAAPNDEERAHHYLWRFWRVLSRAGHMTIFDRSWYGRVLVERVDRLAPEAAWRRAYAEINAFEEQLTAAGIVLVKFWLHVSRDEQLKRLRERAEDPAKRWKLTDDDWRNRRKWDAYVAATNDMVKRTSTQAAPWHLVPADSKKFARIAVMDITAAALETALARKAGR